MSVACRSVVTGGRRPAGRSVEDCHGLHLDQVFRHVEELRNAIEGISHKMLTQNLRMLERNGLLERTVHPVVPPRVDYELTEPGRALRQVVHGMCDWTHTHLAAIEAARRGFGG